MNCKVIGVGIDNSVSILCNAGLVYVYNLRFMYSAIAVAIYLACVCLICLTRKKKQ
jgi:type IV secretory pathway VirB3-like protein